MTVNQTVQIRIGQKTPEKFKNWADNQTNLNESAKRVIGHFIDLYGTNDIDTIEVKIKMAKDLLNVQGKGEFVLPAIEQEEIQETQEDSPAVPEIRESNLEVEPDPQPEVEEKPKTKVRNRGKIDI